MTTTPGRWGCYTPEHDARIVAAYAKLDAARKELIDLSHELGVEMLTLNKRAFKLLGRRGVKRWVKR